MKKTQLAQLIAGIVGVTAATGAFASGFQLLEQSGQGVGNGFAGSAASGEDASTAFFNPAVMPFMDKRTQITFGLDMVKPTAKFVDEGSTAPRFISAGKLGGDGGDAGSWNAVPATHMTFGLNKDLSLGISLGAPFGLKTDYEDSWRGRFHADKSDLKMIALSPSIAYKFTDTFSASIGAVYQHFEAELTQAVNFGGVVCDVAGASLCPLLTGLGTLNDKEGFSQVKGKSDDWGYQLGFAFQPSPSTRIGLAYRSAVSHHLTGDVHITRPTFGIALIDTGLAQRASDGPVSVDVKIPDTFIVSAFQKLDDKWTLQGDISRTGWSSIKTLDIYRNDGSLLSSSYYNWRDTWRVAVGGSYQFDASWKFRAGVAYDQTPVQAEFRTPRLPDSNRTWVSFGANYRMSEAVSFDLGYSHLFMSSSSLNDASYHAEYNPGGINTTAPLNNGVLKGHYDGSVDIIGMQVNYAF
ncbi:outer membrane protein transport protein [Niveibacterium umoris]|uniref:Long-chain fatty acid transport protein n=1 Tax=Niveibacterium umoris TaxID=1193620 RepID=A0A840BVY1_9RHOO|nr:outer membrane protein transport protein [Niveibacterium umoris]MBB4014467.1 long-chain fatty acid transport protein [Niveibacterium umoris]